MKGEEGRTRGMGRHGRAVRWTNSTEHRCELQRPSHLGSGKIALWETEIKCIPMAPEDPPVQSQMAPEDPPVQSQMAPEDPPVQSQMAPEDPPVQSQLNPDAPEFDFTGVSGESQLVPQFGSESYVYLPLPEYTVQEWWDYLYYLQVEACNGYFTGHLVFNLGEVNRVLLTPEYAAYICELTRLLGLRLERSMPMMEYLDPQTMQIHSTGRPGSYLVKWFLDSRKLKSNDKQIRVFRVSGTGQFLRFLIGAFPKDGDLGGSGASSRVVWSSLEHPSMASELLQQVARCGALLEDLNLAADKELGPSTEEEEWAQEFKQRKFMFLAVEAQRHFMRMQESGDVSGETLERMFCQLSAEEEVLGEELLLELEEHLRLSEELTNTRRDALERYRSALSPPQACQLL
ncbi:hypothetical protein AK812_SmicGene3550 [Symbiodinium microadriaticum]|uniref:Uncharacterized protein n=1 Tax=Symbiodinium microadriaticum TaxID=2951 RepID=A0A1Q9EYD3_SYMMI|nr:hypothetical protein AK812_SmicGene3550 [Symbiodinium microadriaticum]